MGSAFLGMLAPLVSLFPYPFEGKRERDTGGLVLKGIQRTLEGRAEEKGRAGRSPAKSFHGPRLGPGRALFRNFFVFLGTNKFKLCILSFKGPKF